MYHAVKDKDRKYGTQPFAEKISEEPSYEKPELCPSGF
jgi:hypothetical protein